ncbi:MAG: heme-binding protein [Alphaproteobacteria bacterium]|nr:heme-binding protein [Alphaproteobacteria bacterium]
MSIVFATRRGATRLVLVAILAAFALVRPAVAQEGTFTVRHLTPETALKAADAALKACRADGFQVAVAVVDRSGTLQVFLRDRFAGPHTVTIATDKAWTAVSMRHDTLELARLSQSGDMSGLRHFPRVVAVGGGLVIEGGGSILAGIGVSGAPGGAADAKCAQAGIEAIIDDVTF